MAFKNFARKQKEILELMDLDFIAGFNSLRLVDSENITSEMMESVLKKAMAYEKGLKHQELAESFVAKLISDFAAKNEGQYGCPMAVITRMQKMIPGIPKVHRSITDPNSESGANRKTIKAMTAELEQLRSLDPELIYRKLVLRYIK